MSDEFYVTSTAFKNGGQIPRKHTAEGGGAQRDMSPPLEFYNVPEGTESLALICEDVSDYPDSPVPLVLWVVANIPPTLKGLPAGFNHKQYEGQKEYESIQEGVNDLKQPGYRGPSSPTGGHKVEFRVYALDTTINLGKKITKEKLVEAMEGHILAETMLVGQHVFDDKEIERHYIPPRHPLEGQALYHNVHR